MTRLHKTIQVHTCCVLRVLICFALFCSLPAAALVVAIKAGRIIDPGSDTTLTNQIVLVEDGKISAIGPKVAIPSGSEIIDLPQQTILPGLIDAHSHLCATVDEHWDLGDFWIMALQRRSGYRAILGAQHAREMLEAGFTTVRDVGNSGDYLDIDLQKTIRFGIVPGPTIIAAGRIIAPYGGQFWDTPADKKLLDNPEYYFADNRDELRKAVRENIYWGAGVIKIVVDGQKYSYSADDIRFIVQEAAQAGVKVAAHVQTEKGARAAIEGGVASIEHVDSFREGGIPPMQILKAMTIDAARLLGVDRERGSLKVGQAADLIAVAGDPTQDIDALGKVSLVMRNGSVFKAR